MPIEQLADLIFNYYGLPQSMIDDLKGKIEEGDQLPLNKIKSAETDDEAFYYGVKTTDAVLENVAEAGTAASIAVIISSISIDVASGTAEVVSLGAATPAVVVSISVSTEMLIVGACGLTASAAIYSTSSSNLSGDTIIYSDAVSNKSDIINGTKKDDTIPSDTVFVTKGNDYYHFEESDGNKANVKNADIGSNGQKDLDAEISNEESLDMQENVVVRHATCSSGAAQSVIDGINPQYFNNESRFGGGFYVTEDGDTAIAELGAHGNQATEVIRFDMNLSGQKVLDLSSQSIASDWNSTKNADTSICQQIAEKALDEGYNVIKFPSVRTGGINYVIYDNFMDILNPVMISPAN